MKSICRHRSNLGWWTRSLFSTNQRVLNIFYEPRIEVLNRWQHTCPKLLTMNFLIP